LMGGEADVSSKEGKGSEFWFTARFNKQAVGAHKESIPSADLHGVRVLIVDDSATSREILTTRTTSWGMRPTEPSQSLSPRVTRPANDKPVRRLQSMYSTGRGRH